MGNVMSDEIGTLTRPVPATARATGRIVVGVDGSEPSKTALAWAARQAALTGASLDVIGVWGDPPYHNRFGGWSYDFDRDGAIREALQRAIDEAIHPESSVAVQIQVGRGLPAEALLQEAEGADLLVVGCRGHNELAGLLLGSVSQHCVAHAHCPVVVVHDHRNAPS